MVAVNSAQHDVSARPPAPTPAEMRSAKPFAAVYRYKLHLNAKA
jgi:hypothetical protein